MSKEKKHKAEIKRLELVKELKSKIFIFIEQKKKEGLKTNDAFIAGLKYGDELINSKIREKPQEKDLIIQSAIRLDNLIKKGIEEQLVNRNLDITA